MSNKKFLVFLLMLWSLLATIGSVVIGCGGPSPPTYPFNQDNRAELAQGTQSDKLPPGATDILHIGNGWYTFRLDVGGRSRLFLYARYATTHSYYIGAITELRESE